jgi:dipeptidyl aminopeptidase/acylaminoacyl peptidase
MDLKFSEVAHASLFVVCLLFLFGCSAQERHPYYSGQPITEPQLFTEAVISDARVASPRFSPDGKTLFFHKPNIPFGHYQMFVSEYRDGQWSKPEAPSFGLAKASDGDMYFSPDGSKMVFVSNRPSKVRKYNYDLWMVEKTHNVWSEPKHLSADINTDAEEINPALAANANLYFISSENRKWGIFVSKYVDGQYQKREWLKLGADCESDPSLSFGIPLFFSKATMTAQVKSRVKSRE